MIGGKPWPGRMERTLLLAKHFAGFDIFDHLKGTAEGDIAAFAGLVCGMQRRHSSGALVSAIIVLPVKQ